MTELQKNLYLHFLKSKLLYKLITGNIDSESYNNTLACIQNLKKLLTHPNMIYETILSVKLLPIDY